MAYRLKPGKFTHKALKRIASEQFARAAHELSAAPVTPAGVHECRKIVKRLRSLLRLVEPVMKPRAFKARNRALGGIGDMLAGARERHVLDETVKALGERFGENGISVLAPLAAHMKSLPSGDDTHITKEAAEKIAAAFAKEARAFAKIAIPGRGFSAIAPGIEATYRTALRGFAKAYRAPSDERFHELRKAVQWHWRHMALLSRCYPRFCEARIADCRDLAEALGADHDLAVLLGHVTGLATKPGSGGGNGEHAGETAGDFSAIILMARTRQNELRGEAYALAERLFAEKPAAFTRRMGQYWKAAKPAPRLGEPLSPPEAGINGGEDPAAARAPRLAVKLRGAKTSQIQE